jgi:peptidoglycan lytic transglycosylase A
VAHHKHAVTHHHRLSLRNASTEPVSFASLEGWTDDDQSAAFGAFLKSCSAILEGGKAIRRARPVYGGLYRVCERAKAAGPLDREQARAFFEANFQPVRILPRVHTYGFYTGADGFFTGYYEATIDGSRHKSNEYDVPLYRPPAKLIGRRSVIFHNLDRGRIESGALAGRGLEICYVKNPVDAFFAQIQGSARVTLDNGKLLRLNYIASNGKHYTPVGHILIEEGIYTPEEMSMDKIREYMEANPKKGRALRLKNKSFVFFSETPLGPKDECIGAEGVPLTPGRSLAVDPSIHVYGTPIWIDAKFPLKSDVPQDPFQHLMVAQDTGSAIRGAARADIYFGHGPDAPHVAGRIKQFGKFVMLVPKPEAPNAPNALIAKGVPLPRPRPATIVADNAPTMTTPSSVADSARAAVNDVPLPPLPPAAGTAQLTKNVLLPKRRPARVVARNVTTTSAAQRRKRR